MNDSDMWKQAKGMTLDEIYRMRKVLAAESVERKLAGKRRLAI